MFDYSYTSRLVRTRFNGMLFLLYCSTCVHRPGPPVYIDRLTCLLVCHALRTSTDERAGEVGGPGQDLAKASDVKALLGALHVIETRDGRLLSRPCLVAFRGGCSCGSSSSCIAAAFPSRSACLGRSRGAFALRHASLCHAMKPATTEAIPPTVKIDDRPSERSSIAEPATRWSTARRRQPQSGRARRGRRG